MSKKRLNGTVKWFDVEKVLEIFKGHFEIAKMEIQVVKRRVPDAG